MAGLFDIVTKSKDIGNEAMGEILTGEKGMSEKEPYELDFFGNKKEPDDYNILDHSVIEYGPNGNIIGSKKVKDQPINIDADKLPGAAADKPSVEKKKKDKPEPASGSTYDDSPDADLIAENPYNKRSKKGKKIKT